MSSSLFDSSWSGLALCACNACRTATSMRTASCRHSTLALVDRRLFSVYAVRGLASARVGEGVVEGVDRIDRRDFDLTTGAGCHVADGQLHSVAFGVPEEEHLVRAAQPLGQFPSWRARAFASRQSGGPVSHRTRPFFLPAKARPSRRRSRSSPRPWSGPASCPG